MKVQQERGLHTETYQRIPILCIFPSRVYSDVPDLVCQSQQSLSYLASLASSPLNHDSFKEKLITVLLQEGNPGSEYCLGLTLQELCLAWDCLKYLLSSRPLGLLTNGRILSKTLALEKELQTVDFAALKSFLYAIAWTN